VPTPQPAPARQPSLLRDAAPEFRALVIAAIVLRLVFVCLPGSQELNFHSGGSDAPCYVLLAQNLLGHLGYAYDGFPSALRPPGYPVLLACAIYVFGSKYIVAVRALQFLLGLITVFTCGATARRLCGVAAGRASLLIGLFLPTLLFTTAQVLTECVAACLTALFLHQLMVQREAADAKSAAALGWTAGLESMFRFNAAALPLFAALAVLRHPRGPALWRRLALALGVPLLIAAPWLFRNEIVFRGAVLFSTQSGPNAVQGVLTSEGRTQPGDSERLRHSLGWELHEVETNDTSRADLPSEAVLDRAALRLVPALWASEGWRAAPLLLKKLADFWLSFDQLLDTGSLPARERLLRVAGILCYWMVLTLAVGGWWGLGLTLMHLPLVMNTRLRIPLMEPLLVILSGLGCFGLAPYFPHLRRLIRGTPIAATPR
jgi:4-amino-4-deoxy-L-arabinose transferase-like glycosyltransferase